MLTIVIPCRLPVNADVTLASLQRQTFQDFDVVMVPDIRGKGAAWARNVGIEKAAAPFILLSDDDINWAPDAIQSLLDTLLAHPEASYAYGAYATGNWIQCNREFDAEALRKGNYISTMSLFRRKDLPAFDESIRRLQDWDLYLTMLEQGKTGVYCGKTIFSTEKRAGITYGKTLSWDQAVQAVRRKHPRPANEPL
jgi:glycosyltransferase involved in cell wall biosynthesis